MLGREGGLVVLRLDAVSPHAVRAVRVSWWIDGLRADHEAGHNAVFGEPRPTRKPGEQPKGIANIDSGVETGLAGVEMEARTGVDVAAVIVDSPVCQEVHVIRFL